MRPTDTPVETQAEGDGQKRPAVLLNLFVSGGSEERSIRLVEGKARQLPSPSEPVTDPEPGSGAADEPS